jgi:hypothetical protein
MRTFIQKRDHPSNPGLGHTSADGEVAAPHASPSPFDFGRIPTYAPAQPALEVAEHGVSGVGGPLPFATQIQRSFGHHHIGGVISHQGARAAGAANRIRAMAYATGERVAFGGAPDLHTAAHEAAHVLQQRAGVKIDGHMGRAGDAYERHADSVADHVVAGRSAEALLDRLAAAPLSAANPQSRVLQCKPIPTKPIPPTNFGTFKVTKFESVEPSGQEDGIDINLEFDPDSSKVDASKIGLIQAARSQVGGVAIANEVTIRKRMVPKGTGEGFSIDRTAKDKFTNPVFGTVVPDPKDKLGDTGMSGGGHWGKSFKDASGLNHDVAQLKDRARLPERGINSGQFFETAAVAVEGKQAGTYMGSVNWGWSVDGKGVFSAVIPTLKSKGNPSAEFKAAAQMWDKASTSGTIKTTASPTDIYSSAFKVKYQVDKDTEVEPIPGAVIHDNIVYYDVTIKSGSHANKPGTIKASDVADVGGGSPLMKVPPVP